MRINFVTPFTEKDAVKALGARWDSAQKQWYIVDVVHLTPFLRWIPDMDAAAVAAAVAVTPIKWSTGIVTTSTVKVSQCRCTVHAWEECPHTAAKP